MEENIRRLEKNFVMKIFINCAFQRILLRWLIEEGKMDGAHSMHRREEKCMQNFTLQPERKEVLGKPKCREENIKTDLR
jgi:hypothetical protein